MKKGLIFAVLFVLIVAMGCAIGAAEKPKLFPIKQGDKWGYIDNTGKIVIDPQFTMAWAFSEGLAPVATGNNRMQPTAFINETGKIVITPQQMIAGSFQDGMAPVGLNGKYGYIDKTGKLVVPINYDSSEPFSEGLAAVSLKDDENGLWGYIDKTGKMVIKPQFASVAPFSDGLAAVCVGKKWGYIDKTGKMVISPKFDIADSFSEGLAVVSIVTNDADQKSKPEENVIPELGKFGYIDKTGKIIIAPQFALAMAFHEGLAAVQIGDFAVGKWGYIDKTGKIVIEPQFEFANNFSEGLAAVMASPVESSEASARSTRPKWGYIDKTGKVVIPPLFSGMCQGEFCGGLARISPSIPAPGKGDSGLEYIDKTGKVVWKDKQE